MFYAGIYFFFAPKIRCLQNLSASNFTFNSVGQPSLRGAVRSVSANIHFLNELG